MRALNKKFLAGFGITSGLVAFLINLHPDLGTRILLFVLFGLIFFGISWARMGIQGIVGGLVIGIIVGVVSGIVVVSIENQLPNVPDYFTGLRPAMVFTKWAVPIFVSALNKWPG